MPNADSPDGTHDFVKQFMDPATHDITIALALRDIQRGLHENTQHLSKQAAEMTATLAEMRAALRENERRISAVEDTHKAEAAIHTRDAARLAWLHRIFGGLITLVLLALWNWIHALSEQAHQIPNYPRL